MTPDSVTSTIAIIKDLIEVIYDKQALTKDEMAITLYLHAMANGDFDWLPVHLSLPPLQAPYTSSAAKEGNSP